MKAMEELVREYQEYKRMSEELAGMIETLSDEIKTRMGDAEQMVVGAFKLTYKPVVQNRIDSTALKKALPDIAAQFTKSVTTRPLRIA